MYVLLIVLAVDTRQDACNGLLNVLRNIDKHKQYVSDAQILGQTNTERITQHHWLEREALFGLRKLFG